MSRVPRYFCECGGELPRPMPHVCPHCGAVISSVRRRVWPMILQVIIVVATFGALLAFLAWLLAATS